MKKYVGAHSPVANTQCPFGLKNMTLMYTSRIDEMTLIFFVFFFVYAISWKLFRFI